MTVAQRIPRHVRLPKVTPSAGVATGAAVVAALGAYAYSREVTEGMVTTGLRDVGVQGGATWGLYIAFVVYFVGVSFAGITVAALTSNHCDRWPGWQRC
jgi:Ni/Fe-hydrogenase subunit HybB-like protein